MRGERGDGEQQGDWIDGVVRVARALGLSPVRVRWKLEGSRQRWQGRRRIVASKLGQVRYRHQICPRCGALVAQGEGGCPRCRAALPNRAVQIAARLGGGTWFTVTRMLTALILLAYAWVALQGGDGSLFALGTDALMRWGANYPYLGPALPPATTDGAWWRLATYMLLHAGVLHIGFNLLALNIVGSMSERVFGGKRTLLVFWVTGVAAGMASLLFTRGVSIGASGSIMGLIGLMAAWGHRARTPLGYMVRGQMIRWAIATGVFGVLIGADNAAHAGGLLAGALLGLAIEPGVAPRSSLARRAWAFAGWVGVLLILLTAAAIPLNPWLGRLVSRPSWQRSADLMLLLEHHAEVQEQACALWREEGEERALAHFLRALDREEPSAAELQELRIQLAARCLLLEGLRTGSGSVPAAPQPEAAPPKAAPATAPPLEAAPPAGAPQPRSSSKS